MVGYKIVNGQDGNTEVKLWSIIEIDALHEALGELGWSLCKQIENGYKIINNQDGNTEVNLESVELISALHEALGELGWGLVSLEKKNKSKIILESESKCPKCDAGIDDIEWEDIRNDNPPYRLNNRCKKCGCIFTEVYKYEYSKIL